MSYLIDQAKKDYATGNYHWFDLQRIYHLPVDVIFAIIFEVKDCSTSFNKENCTTKH